MKVREELDALRDALPGCRLAAYGDLSARIVLCASAAERRPQEELDALCMRAHRALSGAAGIGLAQALNGGEIDRAITLGNGDGTLFLRSRQDASEVLFCVFDAETDIAALTNAGRTTLDRIAELT